MKRASAVAAALATSCATLAVQAEVPTIPDLPMSPAFTAIDLNPTVVTRPTSTGSLGLALTTGVDEGGRIVPGVAIDTAPIWLFIGGTQTLQDWRESPSVQLASRFSLSVATARQPADETAVLGSLALRLVVIDEGDPRHDQTLLNCVLGVLAKPGAARDADGPATIPPMGGDDLKPEREKSPDLEKCKNESRERRQEAGFGLALATALSVRSPNAEIDDVETRTYDFWTDASYGRAFSSTLSGGLGVVGRYGYWIDDDRHAADTGLELRFQIKNRFKLKAAAVWKPQDLSDLSNRAAAFAAGGKAELRVHGDTWGSLEITYQGGDDAPWEGVLALAGLRYAF